MASPAPRQHQPARPEGRLTGAPAAPPPEEGYGLDAVLPWRQALLPPAEQPRQLRNSRDALPDGFLVVAHFYDVESDRKNLDEPATICPATR